MKKRFLGRDVALLMAPVLAVAGLGWWLSKRTVVEKGESKQGLRFICGPPSTLQAFQGYEGGFFVTMPNALSMDYEFNYEAAYLELEPAAGGKPVRYRSGGRMFDVLESSWSRDQITWWYKLRPIPAGKLYFGYKDLAQPAPYAMTKNARPMLIEGKWPLDRSTIQAPNLAAMPRSPRVRLRSVTAVASKRFHPDSLAENVMIGEAIFDLQGPDTDELTPFQISLHFSTFKPTGSHPGVILEGDTDFNRGTAHSRVFQMDLGPTKGVGMIRIDGVISVDDRWPLGFRIEPFRYQDLKAGQKLKFKTFPVPLPR